MKFSCSSSNREIWNNENFLSILKNEFLVINKNSILVTKQWELLKKSSSKFIECVFFYLPCFANKLYISRLHFSLHALSVGRNINCMAMKFKHMAMACLEFNCGHRALSNVRICAIVVSFRVLVFSMAHLSPKIVVFASSLCACMLCIWVYTPYV